ncbi:MAG: hypothetical protein ABJQ34_14350 [Paracoccaceae bacterium]
MSILACLCRSLVSVALTTVPATALDFTKTSTNPAYWHLPNSPETLVLLPDGDRLIYDRSANTLLRIDLAASTEQIAVLPARTLGRENARDFAVFDETGRLFRLGFDEPVQRLPEASQMVPSWRVVIVPNGAAGLSIFRFNEKAELTSILSDQGYVSTRAPLARPIIWTHTGAGFRTDLRPQHPRWHQKYGPHWHMSLSLNDRFLRKSWEIIYRNQRIAQAGLAGVGNREDYWTSGAYQSADPYYQEFIGKLPKLEPLEARATLADAQAFMEQWALTTTLLATEFARYPVQWALRDKPVTGILLDAAVSWGQAPIWRATDQSIVDTLRAATEPPADLYSTILFTRSLAKTTSKIVTDNIVRPIKPGILHIPRPGMRFETTAISTPFGFHLRASAAPLPARRVPVFLIGTPRLNLSGVAKDVGKDLIKQLAEDRFSRHLVEPAKAYGFQQDLDMKLYYPPKPVQETLRRLYSLNTSKPAQSPWAVPKTGGVTIQHGATPKQSNLSRLRSRIGSCDPKAAGGCRITP